MYELYDFISVMQNNAFFFQIESTLNELQIVWLAL